MADTLMGVSHPTVFLVEDGDSPLATALFRWFSAEPVAPGIPRSVFAFELHNEAAARHQSARRCQAQAKHGGEATSARSVRHREIGLRESGNSRPAWCPPPTPATVAFDVPVSREFLGTLGVYAEPGNPIALADAIHSLLNDPETARSLGRNSRLRAAEYYAWEQAGRQILAIYDQLCRRTASKKSHHKPPLVVSRPQADGQESDHP